MEKYAIINVIKELKVNITWHEAAVNENTNGATQPVKASACVVGDALTAALE